MASVTFGPYVVIMDKKKFDRIIFLGLNAQTLGGRLAQF